MAMDGGYIKEIVIYLPDKEPRSLVAAAEQRMPKTESGCTVGFPERAPPRIRLRVLRCEGPSRAAERNVLSASTG